MSKIFYGFYVRNDKDEVVYNEHGYESFSDLENAVSASQVEGTVNEYIYYDKEDPQVEYVFDGPDGD